MQCCPALATAQAVETATGEATAQAAAEQMPTPQMQPQHLLGLCSKSLSSPSVEILAGIHSSILLSCAPLWRL